MECHGSVDSAKSELISLIISVGEPELQNETSPMLPENRLTGTSERSEQQVPRRRCRTLARNCISSKLQLDNAGSSTNSEASSPNSEAARAVNMERWWRRQNLESETVLNGSAQLVELVQSAVWKGSCGVYRSSDASKALERML